MDTVLLFVMYVLMSVVIQPSWLPNPIKLIAIIFRDQIYCRRGFISVFHCMRKAAFQNRSKKISCRRETARRSILIKKYKVWPGCKLAVSDYVISKMQPVG